MITLVISVLIALGIVLGVPIVLLAIVAHLDFDFEHIEEHNLMFY